MTSTTENKIDIFLKFLVLSFPILIILGPFALNSFSIIFTFYAILNYKILKKLNFFDKKIFIIFFSFIILIFPFESIDFKNSFLKYISFSRFILMMLGLIIFLNKVNKNNLIFFQIYKIYVIILTIVIIDVAIEYYFGSNLIGYSSYLSGRIASFTNDELIIGYIYCFLSLFTLVFIYKKTNNYYFFIIVSILIFISFIIGERSNFIKLSLLILIFLFLHFFYFKRFNIKNFLLLFSIIIIFFVSLYKFTINTPQGNKLFFIDDLIISKNEKLSLNIKGRFYQSNHASHYLTAYNIFLNYPIFGIGINNFYSESTKAKYEDGKFGVNTATSDGIIETPNNRASTHPHQIYLEIISEVGLIGLVYCIFIFFYPIYISLRSFKKNKEIYLISHLLLHIFFIFPILPSGSFFGTNYGIPFWFNLSILIYLSNKNFKFHS